MFLTDDTLAPPPARHSWAALPPAEQLLLWSIRHLLVCWPTCGSVEAALHGRYGDEATGVQHLLRCWLTALSIYAARSLTVGDPTCATLTGDEKLMLAVLRAAPYAETRPLAGAALSELCADVAAQDLLPLAVSLAQVAGLHASN